jgi:hypothetical protein
MKIRQVTVEWYHADRRTDMTKVIVAFRSFVIASKNENLPKLRLMIQLVPHGKHIQPLLQKPII